MIVIRITINTIMALPGNEEGEERVFLGTEMLTKSFARLEHVSIVNYILFTPKKLPNNPLINVDP